MGELLSPVEAILQNILGADNILVPPGSQVEEILQAIYYNTEYEKNPESRVAEILLAIKNNGVYDGPVLSRVEDILVHKLNNIPYTKYKKEDLSRVEQLLLDWLEQGGGEEIIEYTGTFPMTILANGEPLLDFLISGNTVQSGTPTPDSPVMPEGTGERTGNLFSGEFSQFDNVGGTGNIYTYFYIPEDFTLTLIAKDTHTIPDNTFLGITKDGGQSTGGFTWAIPQRKNITEGDVFTVKSSTSGYHYVSMYRKITSVFNWILEHYYVMLNLGSTALPYEPWGIKIPISSANTTTPVYLGEVQTTRKIKKLVLTGEEETWDTISGNAPYRIQLPDIVQTSDKNIVLFTSSHYRAVSNNAFWDRYTTCVSWTFSGGVNVKCLVFRDRNQATLADFKTYLAQQYAAGTPVTVWYVLATPTTGIVNDPLMRIGEYTDTLSMEQAGVDVPTNKKPTETVIDVPTSVKPSEGYIKYTEPTDGPTPKTQVLGTKNHEIYMTSNDEVYVLRR